jgi:hypothetical protein
VGPVDVAGKAIISNQDVLNRGSGVADGMTPSDPVTVQQLNSALASLSGGSTPASGVSGRREFGARPTALT